MTTPRQATHDVLTAVRAEQGSDAALHYQRGHRDALEKVAHSVQAAGDRLYQARLEREKAIASLSGEVLAAATAKELHRIKASAARGVCWGCGAAASPHSIYNRCVACDAADND